MSPEEMFGGQNSMSTTYGPERVNTPPHYRQGKIEPIDYIRAHELNFCEGNVVKYVTRWRHKDGVADLLKARDYLNWLIEEAQQAVTVERPPHRSPGCEEGGSFIGRSMPTEEERDASTIAGVWSPTTHRTLQHPAAPGAD